MSVIDTATNTVVATIPLSASPYGVAVNPTGTRVYVATVGGVVVIDTGTNTVVDTITVGTNPVALGQFIGPGSTVPTIVAPIPTLSMWSTLLVTLLIAFLGIRLTRGFGARPHNT